MSEDLIKNLHTLADWVESTNSVHCHSVPRQAAYTIERLEEENRQMYLRLNKRDLTVGDIISRFIGRIRLMIYLISKKLSFK